MRFLLIQKEFGFNLVLRVLSIPIVSDFAIEEEGKEVLKEKIQKEVQSFLDKERVEGQVLEVNIQYIVGS